MKLQRDEDLSVTTVTMTDKEKIEACLQVKKASDLIAVLVALVERHGDLEVWASDHSEIECAWYSPAEADPDRRPPTCIMIG